MITTDKTSSSFKKTWFIFKLFLLFLLLAWASHSGLLTNALKVLVLLDFTSILCAFIALGLTLICGVWRWQWILTALNLPKPSTSIGLKLYYEGLFYNTFAPGAIGGDILRAHWLRRSQEKDSKLHYFITLGERVMGLGTLAIFAIYTWFGPVYTFTYLLFAISTILALPKLIKMINQRWKTALPQKLKLSWFYYAILLNTISHLISFASYILIGQSLGVNLSILEWIEILSITVFAANLPLSVGGVGPREFALVSLLAQQQVPHETALAISIGAFAILVIHSLLGGLIHLLSPNQKLENH